MVFLLSSRGPTVSMQNIQPSVLNVFLAQFKTKQNKTLPNQEKRLSSTSKNVYVCNILGPACRNQDLPRFSNLDLLSVLQANQK